MTTVQNQKPLELLPIYQPTVKGDYDPLSHLKEILTHPITTSTVNPNTPVVLTSSNGEDLTDEDVFVTNLLACFTDTINPDAEKEMKELFGKTLLYFDQKTTLAVQELFAIQAGKKENLPFPSSKVVYTPATDIIPAAKAFLAGAISYDNYFASLAFYARPKTLGIYFATENDFEEFKKYVDNEVTTLQAVLPQETVQLFKQFNQLHLKTLTESLLLRNDDDQNNEEYSFARMILYYIMNYQKQTSPALFGFLPFHVGELVNPKSIVFVNVEAHAHATSKQVANEWDIINQSIRMKPQIVNTKQLQKLTATARTMKKVKQKAASAISQRNQQVLRAKRLRFQKSAPTMQDLTKRIKKVMAKMAQVNRSENSFKSVKMTYQKPNRRNPDDWNKPGKSVSTRYKPDIHLYIDTSGSISEENYQDAVKACIKLAKRLNINLYFNSFSHVLSQATKLETKDKTQNQIYKAFQKVPKVTGGTNYEQIWEYINRSPKRKRELSLIMTDFEYFPPNHYVEHPKNLYYAPISVSSYEWDSITNWALRFCEAMVHIDPKTRAKLLF